MGCGCRPPTARGCSAIVAGAAPGPRGAGRCVCATPRRRAGGPVRVRWNKRVWACPDPGCEAGSWTEQAALAGPRRVLTSRAVGWAVGRLEAVEGSVASSARRLGVGWQTLWSAVEAAALEAVAGPARVGPLAQLGFDETAMASARRHRRGRRRHRPGHRHPGYLSIGAP